jgi:hypothetical protein
MCWRAAQDEQVGQGRQNILVPELPRNDERQAFRSCPSMWCNFGRGPGAHRSGGLGCNL